MLRCSAEPPTSDEDLACRAQQGCAKSFEHLMRRFQTPVLHFLRRRGFAADAEDLAQETFLRAYQKLSLYRRRWAFSAWLFTIARHTSLNHRRRIRPANDQATASAATSAGPEPLDALIADESRRRLWDLAAEILSEESMTAVWLYYVEDMPVRGIALVLRRTQVSVKIILFRARKKLLPLLGEFQGDSRPRGTSKKQDPKLRHAVKTEAPHD
jgi:RNA polymerase sigma-70 factor, ECF subfamily